MYEEFFNDMDKIIYSPNKNSKNETLECDLSTTLEYESISASNNKEDEFINLNVNGLQQYKIIPETRTLIIGGKEYEIDDFFNIKHAIAGDFKTLDYIFTYKGFDIREFDIKKHKV